MVYAYSVFICICMYVINMLILYQLKYLLIIPGTIYILKEKQIHLRLLFFPIIDMDNILPAIKIQILSKDCGKSGPWMTSTAVCVCVVGGGL